MANPFLIVKLYFPFEKLDNPYAEPVRKSEIPEVRMKNKTIRKT